MYNDYYYPTQSVATRSGDTTWLIVSVVLAIVGGICAYFFFVAKPNKGEYTGFVAWLHEFLNFKTYFVEAILKVLYLITALLITLGSFSIIGTSVAGFFLTLILGNVIARISYEFILMFLTIVSNTSEINKKLTDLTKVEPAKTKKTTKED